MPKRVASRRSAPIFTTRKTTTSTTTASGWRISTPKSIDMPTARKNSPSNRPLNGSMSVSRAWRYSESASSTPAMKAPSAIDRPTLCISSAMPTTSNSENEVNISRMLVRAIARSTGRSRVRPPKMTAATTPTALAAAIQWWPSPDPAESTASNGSKAIIGMAAMSWNSRMPKLADPAGVRIRLRSVSVASAMAVDDNASPSPATTAARHGWPTAMTASPTISAHTANCSPP